MVSCDDPPDKTRERQHRVDHQFPAPVIPAQPETECPIGIPTIAAGHRSPDSLRAHLVRHRMLLDKCRDQITVRIEPGSSPADLQPDHVGIHARFDDQVILQIAGVTVVHQIDTGIEIAGAQSRVIRSRSPLGAVIAVDHIGNRPQRLARIQMRVLRGVGKRNAHGLIAGAEIHMIALQRGGESQPARDIFCARRLKAQGCVGNRLHGTIWRGRCLKGHK